MSEGAILEVGDSPAAVTNYLRELSRARTVPGCPKVGAKEFGLPNWDTLLEHFGYGESVGPCCAEVSHERLYRPPLADQRQPGISPDVVDDLQHALPERAVLEGELGE